MDVVCYNY